MFIEDDYIALVISLLGPREIWVTLRDIYKITSAANVDSYVLQYQGLKMQPSEKVMQYVNGMMEL